MNLRRTASNLALFALVSLGVVACRSAGTGGDARPEAPPAQSQTQTTTGAPAAAHVVVGTDPGGVGRGTPLVAKPGRELASFAGGCFWGVEDTFRQIPGVTATAVGYTGGHTKNPTYPEVCTHTTGHAEAVLVEFDPAKITYAQLLDFFFQNHDPTTMNRQGPDIGDQYRSAVFTFSDAQAAAAKAGMTRAEARLKGKHVVTEVIPISAFYKAEDYHQQYDEKTGTHSCPIGLPQGT
ncbi:MAG: Peptide methionine sulfoxide reductase MsrA [Myxococcaceae bacterium]|nr:Peptide methionine sulfoxide reductase MsrA [Myxococcaceae bacterium]